MSTVRRAGDTPMTIDGAVTGQVLGTFQVVFNLNNRQMCELFSIQSANIKKTLCSPDPVPPEMAILLRMYLRYPDMLPRRPHFDMPTYYESVGCKYVRKRSFATAFGVDAGRSYGWLEKAQNPSSRVVDLGNLISKIPNGYVEMFREARVEAAARQVNPFLTGSWSERVGDDASANYFQETDLLRELPRGRAARRVGSVGMAPPAQKRGRKKKEAPHD